METNCNLFWLFKIRTEHLRKVLSQAAAGIVRERGEAVGGRISTGHGAGHPRKLAPDEVAPRIEPVGIVTPKILVAMP